MTRSENDDKERMAHTLDRAEVRGHMWEANGTGNHENCSAFEGAGDGLEPGSDEPRHRRLD